ncbi:MAG: PAS domain S-box protein [Sneathiella sp.]|nr:PAS domain S-box protein [Sneathiella sp.]
MNLVNLADTLLRDMPDGLIVSDADNRIRLWNAGAERIFGFTAAEAIGQSLDIIIPDTLRGRHGKGYRETMQTGVTRYSAGDLLAVPALRKDGTGISIQFSILPLADPDGKMTGVAAIVRDVTADFNRKRELESALRDCRRATRAD